MPRPVSKNTLSMLHAALPSEAMKPVTNAYVTEERGRWHGQAATVLTPASAEEVSAILRIASDAEAAVVPYGGGTGLVGGQIAPDGPAPLVLSLERMSAIRACHPDENVIVAEAGATLADVQSAARDADRLFPLSYGSEGTARIGGALAVNSGGLNVVRYGMARDLCLGIEAVLPDGQVIHGLKRLRKDNTGYDIRNLMIGSEGTLGVITAASLRLFPIPRHTATAFVVVRDPSAALELFHMVAAAFGNTVSAFEIMSGEGFRLIAEAGVPARLPFDTIPDWCVLLEIGAPDAFDPDAALERALSVAFDAGMASDALLAQSVAQKQEFWRVREAIPLANKAIGAIASNDISLPLGALAEFVEACTAAIIRLGPVRVNAFGHLGDGNLHYNVFPQPGHSRAELEHLRTPASDLVHEFVHRAGGSFSAEHGIGRMKVVTLEQLGDPAKLSAMRAIKAALDPKGIMNPGAVLKSA